MNLVQTKGLLKSRTVWGSVASAVCGVLAIAGVGIDGLEQQIVEAGLAVGTLLGFALTIYGRFKAEKKLQVGKRMNTMLSLMLVVSITTMAAGCAAVKNLPAHDQALVYGDEMLVTYNTLEKEYFVWRASDNAKIAGVMKTKVAPALDAARYAIVAYRDAAAAYKRTKVEPLNMGMLWDKAQKTVNAALAAFASAKGVQ